MITTHEYAQIRFLKPIRHGQHGLVVIIPAAAPFCRAFSQQKALEGSDRTALLLSAPPAIHCRACAWARPRATYIAALSGVPSDLVPVAM